MGAGGRLMQPQGREMGKQAGLHVPAGTEKAVSPWQMAGRGLEASSDCGCSACMVSTKRENGKKGQGMQKYIKGMHYICNAKTK